VGSNDWNPTSCKVSGLDYSCFGSSSTVFPSKIENEKLKFTVFSIVHNDACSAFPMVLFGIVGMTAVSVPLFKSVEMIQISYFALFLLIRVCEWVSWGTEYADLVDILHALLLLLAHSWMLNRLRSVQDDARVVMKANKRGASYEPIQ
jgi:hypothetical protein